MAKCNESDCRLTFNHIEKECQAEQNPSGFSCTRIKGHEGDHIACGIEEHDYATWPQRHEVTKCPCLTTKLVIHNGPMNCREWNDRQSLFCTLPKGHKGDHLACRPQADEHNLGTWPQQEDVMPEETKFEITLTGFEAAVIMRLCSNTDGRSNETKAARAIYEALGNNGARMSLAKDTVDIIEFARE